MKDTKEKRWYFMKRYWFYGVILFIFSIIVGFVFSKMWVTKKIADANLKVVGNTIQFVNEENKNVIETGNVKVANTNVYTNNEVIQTDSEEEKVSPNSEFALKKFYTECSHFKFEYATLPNEIVNLTKTELEQYYDDWEVDEFSNKRVVLVQEVNSLCDEHFIIKLGEKFIEIYHLEPDGNLELYRTTDISKEYLTQNDIKTLENGYYVFGEGKLNSVLEDFE
jgi:hypothetical protein